MAGQLLRRSCGRLVVDPCVHTRCSTHACTPGARQNATLKLSASVSSSRQRSWRGLNINPGQAIA
ncbi:hypothetical protein GBA52_016205 [Prunus armeniaca]|nr:hypothetical protein GBA52_016205 [Prunus armeniaca]